ncbi:Hypothetical predicted protein [Marmota monax]|uniref:Uncharacterized protein n=1 Tax=Marmota monax TaxID=9995 RepID=A0A5E4BJ15_MARMO|nr:Hypothetical predicted protein [Marmota monax]
MGLVHQRLQPVLLRIEGCHLQGQDPKHATCPSVRHTSGVWKAGARRLVVPTLAGSGLKSPGCSATSPLKHGDNPAQQQQQQHSDKQQPNKHHSSTAAELARRVRSPGHEPVGQEPSISPGD